MSSGTAVNLPRAGGSPPQPPDGSTPVEHGHRSPRRRRPAFAAVTMLVAAATLGGAGAGYVAGSFPPGDPATPAEPAHLVGDTDESTGAGTRVVIALADGAAGILANAHVVGATSVTLPFDADSEPGRASAPADDTSTDVAVLEVVGHST